MKNIYTGVEQFVGKTPILHLEKLQAKLELKANVFAKLEYMNPAGSIKDRPAKFMIEEAEKSGALKKGSTIIEPTSGNTGIGLAAIAASKGYDIILVMPETMSIERRKLLAAYGAKLVLSEGAKGMKGAIEKANELASEIENSFIPAQFDNPVNAMAHKLTTAPEIYADMDGDIDIFVSAIGTGGTITGIGEYLKEKNPNIKVVAVEPAASPFLSKGQAGPHKIQGIGAGFAPSILNQKIYDEIITVENDTAFEYGIMFGKTQGVLVGISSGAALYAASQLAMREENKGKNIVVILPDGGDRYLSTPLFD